MSFGWSAGDVIAGLKALWDVWQAVADGPLNAKYEATQFFDQFYHVISRLDDWERRKSSCAKDERLVQSHRELRVDCTEFIKKHFALIQRVNPNTKAIRAGRSTWVQKVAFTRSQVVDFYRQVEWPTQRAAVARLREKLRFFLSLAAYDITVDIHQKVTDFGTTQSELIATNHKLVASHLDFVGSITANLKRITNPLDDGQQAHEIDYPFLRQFERALHLPPPIAAPPSVRLLEESTSQNEAVPWSIRRRNDEAQYATIASSSHGVERDVFGEEDRGLISQRLENLSMRVKKAETMATITESSGQDAVQPTTQQLLARLREIRVQTGDAVGVLHHVPQADTSLTTTNPRIAIQNELLAWETMRDRIERARLHPSAPVRAAPVGRVWTMDSTVSGETVVPASAIPTLPMTIQPRRISGNLSPPASYDGWTGPTRSSSRNTGSLSSSPNERRLSISPKDRRMSSNSRTNSTSSIPRRSSIRSDHDFSIHLQYPQHTIRAVIRSISKNDEGDVLTISSYSTDGLTRYRHCVDTDNEDLKIETSMIPFVDSHHVAEGYQDPIPKFRVQFQGIHNLKVLVKADNREVAIAVHPCPPIYKFLNESDFLEFQSVLLNKEVKHHADVHTVKSYAGQVICRIATHMNLPSDQRAGFVELPVSHFKTPTEPSKRTKTLALERQEGSKVSSPKGAGLGMGMGFNFARQGSVNTIASNETSAAPAFARMGQRSVRGLVIEFYDAAGCHTFWEQFTKIEPAPTPFERGDGLGLNIESGFSVQLPGS